MEEPTFELSTSSEPAAPAVETPSTPENQENITGDTVETPAPTVTPEANNEPMLYDTPDGRKVSAEILQKEWKENFLPDYTRKSQELAEIRRKDVEINKVIDIPAWKQPDYIPESYADVIEIAKQEALKELETKATREQDRMKAVQTQVETEIAELKKTDPTLDENSLFAHATKYGFNNVKTAYQNMSDMKKSVIEVEQRTLKNMESRRAVPVAVPVAKVPDMPGEYDSKISKMYNSASDYLDSIRNKI